ncbi:ankyrin repeat-containing [Fusarium agapanthi]|uniref:Ankyrin repeat-containing n=1 Tax=Fusarium agapanthi TaxID=1803897 RepID=A0A9P5B335_9HYPO|nr:ankyrin repeat-containing [Fusarium agapanthi]
MSGGTAHQTGPGHMFNFQGTGNVFHLKQRILALPTADPIDEFLKTLVFPDMNSRWHDITPAVDGTCTWIFSNPEYEKWEQGKGHRLFWIEGGPGCGKSTLFKCLRDYHSTTMEDASGMKVVVLSFFFHAQGIELQRSRLGLFRALLYQLVSQMPDLKASFLEQLREESRRSQQRAEKIRQDSGKDTKHDNGMKSSVHITAPGENGEGASGRKPEVQAENLNWHFTELKQFLSAFLHKASQMRSIWIFVDAIDECCNETAESLVQLLKTICHDTYVSRGGVRVCFSSRDHTHFDRNYGYSVNPKSENRNDIAAYAQTKLSDSEVPFFKQDPYIADFIAEEASGMFVWAQMITERILKPEFTRQTPDSIRVEIKHYSGKDLDNLYGGVLKGMQRDVESLCLMEWLTFCETPLAVDQIQWAMALHPLCSGAFKRFSDVTASPVFRTFSREEVISLSRGLVEISGNRVQFKHQSMRDFFRDRGCARLRIICGINTSISPRHAKAEAHGNLSCACLKYLKLMDYEASQKSDLFKYRETMKATTLDKEFPLARYSTTYWTTHAKQCELHTAQSESQSRNHSYIKENLGHQPHNLEFWLQCGYTFAADFDSVGHTISAICTDRENLPRKEELFPRGKTNLIHIAARMGLASLFDTLVQECLHDNSLRPSRQRSKIDILDFNTDDDYGFTVLYLAAVGGNEYIVKKIIDSHHFIYKPLNLRSTMIDYERRLGSPVIRCPLVMALCEGHADVAKILLNHKHKSFDPSKMFFSCGLGTSLVLNGGHAIINIPRYGSNLTIPLRIAQTLAKGSAGPKEEEGSRGAGFIRRTLKPVGQFLMNDPDEAMGMISDEVLKGVDVLETDIPMGNALHLMAHKGSLEMVKILVASNRVDINATNTLNITPLAFAAGGNHGEIVDYLLKEGAKSHTSVHYRDTPLFCALNAQIEGGERVIKVLLKQDIPESSSQLALHLAAARLLGDDRLVESCVKKKPKLLRPFAQSLEKKTWPEDWAACRRLLYEYIRGYEAEWVKDKVENATDWVKEVKEKKWWKSKKPRVELL